MNNTNAESLATNNATTSKQQAQFLADNIVESYFGKLQWALDERLDDAMVEEVTDQFPNPQDTQQEESN